MISLEIVKDIMVYRPWIVDIAIDREGYVPATRLANILGVTGVHDIVELVESGHLEFSETFTSLRYKGILSEYEDLYYTVERPQFLYTAVDKNSIDYKDGVSYIHCGGSTPMVDAIGKVVKLKEDDCVLKIDTNRLMGIHHVYKSKEKNKYFTRVINSEVYDIIQV